MMSASVQLQASRIAEAEEIDLVALARHQDEGAVRELIRRHNQRLFRTARSVVHSDSEAEDVVQASYVKAFTHLDGFRGEARFATWLTRITLNEALERLRRKRVNVPLDHLDTGAVTAKVIAFPTLPQPADPEMEVSRTEVRVLLERAIDALPDTYRTVFVLRDIEGLDIAETAEQLGIRTETVKTRLFRARRQLRETLESQFGTAFATLFPFDGQRCVAMADRVVAALNLREPRL